MNSYFILTIRSKNIFAIFRFIRVFIKMAEVHFNYTKKVSWTKKKKKIFTILKSPHVNKSAQEQYEINWFYKQLVVHVTQKMKFLVFLKTLKHNLLPEVHCSATSISNKRISVNYVTSILNPMYFLLVSNRKKRASEEKKYKKKKLIKLTTTLSKCFYELWKKSPLRQKFYKNAGDGRRIFEFEQTTYKTINTGLLDHYFESLKKKRVFKIYKIIKVSLLNHFPPIFIDQFFNKNFINKINSFLVSLNLYGKTKKVF